MSDNIEKKPGRPSKGMDYERVSVRLSKEESDIISKYRIDHGTLETSAAIHASIELMGECMKLSDNIETSIGILLDFSEHYDGLSEKAMSDGDRKLAKTWSGDAERFRETALMLHIFCYNENLPGLKKKRFNWLLDEKKCLCVEGKREKDADWWDMIYKKHQRQAEQRDIYWKKKKKDV